MLKSTKIALEQTRIALNQTHTIIQNQKEQNNLKREELNETKRHNLVEEETKDRVDISKKEYLELLEENKKIKNELDHTRSVVDKLLAPLIDLGVSYKICEKILANDFESYGKAIKNIEDKCLDIHITYKVPLKEIAIIEELL